MTGAASVIGRNELYRVFRDRTALFFILVLPVVIMMIIGATFFGEADDLPIGVIDLDRSEQSARIQRVIDDSPALATQPYSAIDALELDLRTGRVDAGLVIAAGGAEVELITDPIRRSTGALRTLVRGLLAGEGARVGAARLATELTGTDIDSNLRSADALRTQLATVDVQIESTGTPTAGEGVNQFSYTAPGNLVLFVFVNSLAIAASLVQARQLGVLSRMRAGPLRTSTILIGFGLSRVVFGIVQSVLLLAVGAIVFGVDFGDPVGVALLVLAFSLLCAGAGLLVGSVVRNGDQAQAIGIPVSVAMGMLGGAMWPLEIVGPTMRAIGHIVPHAWAMDAWTELVFDGASARDVLGEVTILMAYAAVLILVGSRLLHRRLSAS